MSTLPVRRTAGVLAGALALVGGALSVSPAGAAGGFALERLEGANRYETAAATASATFNAATTAVIARGDDFADALTGSYLAGVFGGPVLLTHTNDLPEATATTLQALGVKDVFIVGGQRAVSDAVQTELEQNYSVRRLFGSDRYITAEVIAKVAASQSETAVGEHAGLRTAILGNGQSYPDVLAGGPLSYARSLPIALTLPNALPSTTHDVLVDLDIEQVIVVGGDSQVSPGVRAKVEQITGNPVIRLAGDNRWQTAAVIAQFAYDQLGFDTTHVQLARSDDFADSLTGGAHAGVEQAPILLTPPAALHAEVDAFLAKHSATLTDGHVFGGPKAVSDATVAAAEQAATG